MFHPWITKQLVKEHQNTLLKEAEAYRITIQAKHVRRVQHSPLNRIRTGLVGLLHASGGQLADQVSCIKDEALYR